MENGMPKEISRRGFLLGTAAGVGGMALVSRKFGFLSIAEAKNGPTEKWPWPYEKLDPVKTAELAYDEWYRIYCGGAVISSVFTQLRDKVGEPYKSFPIDSFIFLEGGVSGWGTICGSVMGANLVTNNIIGPRISGSEDGALMGSELMQWYSDAEMPVYKPKSLKVTAELPKTTSNSPLCHVSVGKWMTAANKPLKSPERKDRCARVTASVAYQLVTLLNDWKDKKYKTKGVIPSSVCGITAQSNCTECHNGNVPVPPKAM